MSNSLNLNEKELQVIKALAQEMRASTNGDFGYMEDVVIPAGISKAQFAGYCGALGNKKAFEFTDTWKGGQFALKPEYYAEYLQQEPTAAQMTEIEKMARIAQAGKLIAQIAVENGLEVDDVLPIITGIAKSNMYGLGACKKTI